MIICMAIKGTTCIHTLHTGMVVVLYCGAPPDGQLCWAQDTCRTVPAWPS